ncbi:PAS domain-containing protein [Mesorhizobium sp. CA10]|uniref:PAS domain-containing protein n=1 Tax=Mesorhizobium sp. CA10 TaxID=588495 RepID=UPI001CCFB1B0|nr:PAS domain-containing protein [Mesorhizobium sp. CA10]MBZ9885090.1 PAS domain-containing protein [Mesorhizobium sp. CA10]
MEPPVETSWEENQRLKRSMNDLVSLLALPAICVGEDPVHIASTLLDVLSAMLPVDFVYARLFDTDGACPNEIVRVGQACALGMSEIGKALDHLLGETESNWPSSARMDVGVGGVFLAVARLGLEGEAGVLVVGSAKADFPSQSDQLLLSVAANQASIALQGARQARDQNRLAKELDQRVTERTSELVAANRTLMLEIEERRRTEEALRESKEALATSRHDLQLIVDTIPAFAWLTRPDGYVEFFSQHYLDYAGLSAEQSQGWGWTAIMHPDDLDELTAKWQALMIAGVPGEAEARVRRSDGTYRWFLIRANPSRDEYGKIIKWYGADTDIDERKRAEEKVIDAERELQRMIDGIPALVGAFRADGSQISSNKRGRVFTGLSSEDIANGGWRNRIHPEDVEAEENKWLECIATGEPFELEYRVQAADGTYRWHMARRIPIRDDAGKVMRWYGVSHDIDGRKQAEAFLAGEKRLLEMIASGSSLRDVLSALCTFVEEAAPDCFCDVHMFDQDSLTIAYAVAPSLPSAYSDPIAGTPLSGDLLPCGIAAVEKVQVVTEDIERDPRWYNSPVRSHVLRHGYRSVWSTPVCSKEGRVLATFCIIQRKPSSPSPHQQDLIAHATQIASIAIERSLTEAALRRTETLLSEAQRLSSTGAFSWRVDTDEIAFSEELYRIFEFDPAHPVTMNQILDRIHPDDIPSLSTHMARVRAGEGNLGYEIRIRMPDHSVKFLRTFGRVVRRQDDRLECLAAVQDVTEYRRAEEALGKARTELAHVSKVSSLGTLTASIAHEVNQPLSGIVTNASTCLRMLAANPPNIDGALETARRTIRDGNLAADVIARLRALFSKRAPIIEAVDLNEAVREVLALSSGDIRDSRVVLQSQLAEGLPHVAGDRVQLQQVIMNLLRNAADAMSEIEDRPRQVMIRTEPEANGHVRLSVQDTGTGFGPDGSHRLFEAFYTTKSDGMGIGLSISRSIIDSHCGRLWAAANDGPGVTFSFSVPEFSAALLMQDMDVAHNDKKSVGVR